jgi:hypothetical protein
MSPKACRVLTALALDVLQLSIVRAPSTDAELAALRLALRCLLGLNAPKDLLARFWGAATGDMDIGRHHGTMSAYEALRDAVGAMDVEPASVVPDDGHGQRQH